MSVERNTHLFDWLHDGYTHCQHGTKEWCEDYLRNASDVIKAQDVHIVALLDVLVEAKKALGYSSSSLDSITTDDEEDMAPDGGSKACQACIKINNRAIAKIDAYLASSPDIGDGEG